MTNQTTRAPSLVTGWMPTEPEHERQARHDAWQQYHCCRDCRFWETEDGSLYGGCDAPAMWTPGGAVITPEDYTCKDFKAESPYA